MVAKKAEDTVNYARRVVVFQSARKAFEAILSALEITRGKILLPAYIGWSPREGSGVFDPVTSLRLDYSFYALDERLHIDIGSLRSCLQSGDVRVLVIIHYFGYVDPSYTEAVKIAKEYGVFVLEDEAHAMLSDIVGGICGRLGDACIYSFHKILPIQSGGAAVINNPRSLLSKRLASIPPIPSPLYEFDLLGIAKKRRSNSIVLDKLIRDLAPEIEPIFGAPGFCEYPQSYPVRIRVASRDSIYVEMNAANFGVVSLYHTLISQISPSRFSATVELSRQILNLPVHQDASEDALEYMVRDLVSRVRKG